MNPILTITVEGTKASSAGTVSVGEKIDVSVTGLGSISIPFLDEAETKSSLRFRLVDEQGHDIARFPLESTDAWTVTSGTYSATSVNLNTTALRKAFEGVAYGDRLQFGIILDSAKDYAQYARGKTYVQQWSMSSIDDPKVLPDWSEVLAKLETDLATVSDSKATAIESASAAVSAKNAASSYSSQAGASALTANAASQSATANANSAAQSASAASEKADEASTSASNSETYKNQASYYADSASAAADRAESVLSASVKKIGDTMTGTLAVPAVTLNGADLAGLISSAEASAEAAAQSMVSEEAESRENADEVLSTTMAEEVQDRKDADLALAAGISTERARAEGAESTLTANLASEVSRAKGVENEIRQLAGGELKLLVVSSLPSTGVEKTIYLVPSEKSETGNVKDEYLWVNSAWEKIGSTAVDLTPYLKKDWVTSPDKKSATGEAADSRATYLLLNGKLNKYEVIAPAQNAEGYAADAAAVWTSLNGKLGTTDQAADSAKLGGVAAGDYLKKSGGTMTGTLGVDGNGNTMPILAESSSTRYCSNGISRNRVVDGIVYQGGFNLSFPGKGGVIATVSDIKTKVSELTNDSGFVTADSIPVQDNIANSSSKIDAVGNVYTATTSGNYFTTVDVDNGSTKRYLYDSYRTQFADYKYVQEGGSLAMYYRPSDGGILNFQGSKQAETTTGVDPTSGASIATCENAAYRYVFTPATSSIPSDPTDRLAREYPIKSLTVSSGAATALDSTINTITPTATTTIAPPDAKSIGARDWLVVVTQGSTAYGVTFSGSFVAESGFSWPTMEASKTYVFSFTEVASNKFLAAVKEVANV